MKCLYVSGRQGGGERHGGGMDIQWRVYMFQAAEEGVSAVLVGWIFGSFPLAQLFFSPLCGKLESTANISPWKDEIAKFAKPDISFHMANLPYNLKMWIGGTIPDHSDFQDFFLDFFIFI